MSLMYVKWGNFQFQSADPTISITKTALRAPVGTRIGYTEQWTLTGEITADTQNDLTVSMRAMEAAFSSDFKNLILYDNEGNPSAHQMLNKDSSSGTQLVSFFWLDGPGEYVVSRKYQLVVKADFITGNPGIVAYTEVISMRGGGSKWVLKSALKGIGQRQQLNGVTPFHAVQMGTCINYLDWAPPPQPIWPNDHHTEQSQITYKTPQFMNNQLVNFETTWNYVFESFSSLSAKPRVKGVV